MSSKDYNVKDYFLCYIVKTTEGSFGNADSGRLPHAGRLAYITRRTTAALISQNSFRIGAFDGRTYSLSEISPSLHHPTPEPAEDLSIDIY